jgi:hypothetical protein
MAVFRECSQIQAFIDLKRRKFGLGGDARRCVLGQTYFRRFAMKMQSQYMLRSHRFSLLALSQAHS